ncbi:MAG TPA: complex I subunit 1 family protein [Candidatus Acidoferrales bacterium]|jgi:NADH-quinone oxidoreductase subunit H|nr:complex I subunit 1 family protein [Candidatus Acidoferrales bacterium]
MGHLIPQAILPYVLPVVYAVVIVMVLPLLAGYIVLMERKVMADMQARLGPMRVGPHGLLQPIADAVKLLLKEDIIPENADRLMFWLAPLVSVTMALLAYSALPIGPAFQIADLNIGLLFILAISSLGIYGIVLGGWASNSHYSLLGALRSAAQLVSYETAAGLGLVSVLLLAGSLSMKDIVQAQMDQGVWFIFSVPFGFFIYLVGSIAETNRAPFDLPEAESELVAGYMTEYSGFRWSLYFLAEYANMVIVAGIATTVFLGGWLRPLASFHEHFPGTSIEWLDAFPSLLTLGVAFYCLSLAPKQPVKIQKIVMLAVAILCFILSGALLAALFAPTRVLQGIHGAFWFMAKVFAYLYAFLWFRFTFPRYRFDQLMRLGWRFLIPLALVNVIGVGVAIVLRQQLGWGPVASLIPTTLATLGVAIWLAKDDAPAATVQTADGE